jgi:hypothetical protein
MVIDSIDRLKGPGHLAAPAARGDAPEGAAPSRRDANEGPAVLRPPVD